MARVYKDRTRKRGKRTPWCLDYTDDQGRRRREVTNATTKKEAEGLLRKRLENVEDDRRTNVALESVGTFGGFVRMIYLPVQKQRRTESTYRSNLSLAETILRYFGSMKLDQITAQTIESYMRKRRAEKTRRGRLSSPATVNRERSFISAVMNLAVEREMAHSNPAQDVDKLVESDAKVRWLSPAEEERLLIFAPRWLRPLIQFALHTGMQLTEILNLKWANYDAAKAIIWVIHPESRVKRQVPLNPVSEGVLTAVRPFIGRQGHAPFVFVNANTGKPYTNGSVGHALAHTIGQAGLRDVTFETFRHTFVARLIQRGAKEKDIRAILGRASTSLIARYQHLAPQDLHSATAVLVPSPMGSKRAKAGRGA